MGVDLLDLREIHSIGQATKEWMVGPDVCPALKRLGVALTGVSAAREGFRFVRSTPEWNQLLVTCAGSGRVLVDGAWHGTAPGDGYLTPAGARHAYHTTPGKEWLVCWVMFAADDLPAAPSLVTVDHRPLHDAIINLQRETVGRGDAAVAGQWAGLLHLLLRRCIGGDGQDRRLWRLWETVDADPAHGWTLDDLAVEAGVGAEQLRRLCRKQLGRSPMAQVAHLRMRRAGLLLAGGHKVAAVAEAVGYENPFAFSTAFRRIMGKAPSLVGRR